MKGKLLVGALVVAAAMLLGATVLREPIALAAQSVAAEIIGPLDGNGNVRVHEQGTANVNVTNGSLKVTTDEVPYEHTVFFNQTDQTCTQFVCNVSFPAVPAGKRLIITYASARWALTAGGNGATVSLGVNGNGINQPQILLPAAVLSGTVNWVAAGPVTFYAKAGDVPTMSLQGQFTQPVSNTAVAAMVGHLVDAP